MGNSNIYYKNALFNFSQCITITGKEDFVFVNLPAKAYEAPVKMNNNPRINPFLEIVVDLLIT